MANVYAWPPVRAVGSEWTIVSLVQQSRSILSGRRYVSAAQRERRQATVVVSSLAGGATGAGYCEVLKQLLDGGVNLVRLRSHPVNWHRSVAGDQTWRQRVGIEWTSTELPLEWTEGGTELLWFKGADFAYTQVPGQPFPTVRVTGLSPDRLVARPGEFANFRTSAGADPVDTHMILERAQTDSAGVAVVRLVTGPGYDGVVSLGTEDTGVFEALEIPRAVQPIRGDWTYTWRFSEVFEDEVADGFTEVDPWI